MILCAMEASNACIHFAQKPFVSVVYTNDTEFPKHEHIIDIHLVLHGEKNLMVTYSFLSQGQFTHKELLRIIRKMST